MTLGVLSSCVYIWFLLWSRLCHFFLLCGGMDDREYKWENKSFQKAVNTPFATQCQLPFSLLVSSHILWESLSKNVRIHPLFLFLFTPPFFFFFSPLFISVSVSSLQSTLPVKYWFPAGWTCQAEISFPLAVLINYHRHCTLATSFLITSRTHHSVSCNIMKHGPETPQK